MTKIINSSSKIDCSIFNNSKIIVIDGDQGSGKSDFARKIKIHIGGKHFEVDDYLKKNGDPYIEQIKYTDLKNDLAQTNSYPIILDGVCMLKVLEKLNLIHDYFIFSKRIINDNWEYSQYFRKNSKLPKSVLSKELVQYYKDMKPFKLADLIMEFQLVS